ncbi:general stress protein [Pleomorphomonas sp. PLEO]|uniref:general stress protein n=1 Tax=Pleomorphomonas sp. PLEO TaxID=3239306 RepID=UPI00351DD4F1
MHANNSVVAIFDSHETAEGAVKKLTAGGFDMKNLSIVGKGYHTEEKVVGFYSTGDRVRFWGARGAFWGGLWGLFLSGMFVTVPFIGSVVVLGYFAATLVSALETAVVVGGLSALGAGFYSLGIPKDSVLEYESAIRADSFVVMAHGSADEVAKAKEILSGASASRVDVHLAPAAKNVPVAVHA